MKLDKVIYEMLTENTGSHFLDSGDHYGRHYERNATKTLRDFKAEPVEKVTKSGGYYEREVSVFHYLMNMGIEVTPLCKQFNKYNVGSGDWDGEVYGVSKGAWEWLTSNYEVSVEKSFNTYNHDCDLSQVLQGTNLIINSERYIMLQVHGGCDVRGWWRQVSDVLSRNICSLGVRRGWWRQVSDVLSRNISRLGVRRGVVS